MTARYTLYQSIPRENGIPFRRLIIGILTATVIGCATSRTDAPLTTLRREDALWLERVSFGLDSASVAEYRRLGRERYLDRQLHPGEVVLPQPIAAQVAALGGDRPIGIVEATAQVKAVNDIPAGPDRESALKALNERGNKLAYRAARRDLLRAIYSPAQLQEQMVWFWTNHFNVHERKERLRWLVGDYGDSAIRPHALGHFKELVLATLEHPAMLQYLDNAQNAGGHLNENYARELMELHTLGVDGGYSQQDVQNLARVLSGAGIETAHAPKLKPEWQRLYVHTGAFEFNPARHDFGPKVLLGHTIQQKGFAEIEEAIDVIVAQPACARFVSRQLALYFVADEPSPALVERMAVTFRHTDGDIAAVLRTMFLSKEFDAALGAKFKDPMRFVVSAVRFAYDGRPISNTRPLLNWLQGLGEAPYERATPDGYPLTELNWASSGQMSRRFEIARAIGAGNAGLFDAEAGQAAGATGFPQLSNRLYFESVEPFLTSRTKQALEHASSQQEWNTFLLSSPEFSYE